MCLCECICAGLLVCVCVCVCLWRWWKAAQRELDSVKVQVREDVNVWHINLLADDGELLMLALAER